MINVRMPGEQEAAGLSGGHPTAGARRPLHLLRRAGLTHRVSHPTRGVCADPFGRGRSQARLQPARWPLGRGARRRSRWPSSCSGRLAARPAEARRARSVASARRSLIASPQAPDDPDRDEAAGVADDLRKGRRIGGDDRGAGGHRLEGREAEALVARRHRHDVGELEQPADVGVRDAAEASNVLPKRRAGGDLGRDGALARPGPAGEHQHRVGMPGEHRFEGR